MIRYNTGMESLKPQDVVVALKLCVVAERKGKRLSIAALSVELGMSSSEVHAAIRRGRTSGFLSAPLVGINRRAGVQHRPNTSAILEFLVHGLKYVFPARRGELTRGLATSYGAPPLKSKIGKGAGPVPVWPSPEGTTRGVALEPLYPTVPFAASRPPPRGV